MASKNVKKKSKSAEVSTEDSALINKLSSQGDYVGSSDPNELMIVPGQKRKAQAEEGPIPKKKDATGGKIKLGKIRKEKEKERVTKKMKRQLKQVQMRKANKDTQADLFAALAEYQLDSKKLNQLGSTIHMQDKDKPTRADTEPSFPSKLKTFSGKVQLAPTIHQKERKQENYYETDDDEDSSEEEEEEQKPSGSKSGGEIQIDEEEPEALASDTEPSTSTAEAAVSNSTSTTAEISLSTSLVRKDADKQSVKEEEKDVDSLESDEADTKKKAPAKTVISKVPAPTVLFIQREHILVARTEEVEKQRSNLPIYAEEVPIVEAINENTATVVCGETGSGKTTQIPQFLYEAGYTTGGQLIGITEPRRVAAISMAERVGYELGLPDVVSYQIRYESNRTEKTKILFMTDGVLMKEMETDVMLNKYSVIMIDEAHERSMYSDVLIGMLSRIAPLRAKTSKPLKLVIMSATLRLTDFTSKRLFPTVEPHVVKVDSRQFPVTVHFEKRTPENHLQAAFRKACRIHETLPDGTVLIFVSGQQEVTQLIKRLTARYPIRYEKTKSGEKLVRGGKKWKQKKLEEAKSFKLEDFKEVETKDKTPDTKDMDGEDMMESGVGGDMWDDYDEEAGNPDEDMGADLGPPPSDCAPLYCLPLYSLLSTEKQKRVFQPPVEGARMCVIATNVAETSLTIPGVKYVVDTGFEKRRLYDPITGVSQFVVARTSQASADQRAGRAGRIAAGHAYRLYSSAVFQDLEKFSRPEILDKPADQLVLHLKAMNIVKVINFPFPSAPEADTLEIAEARLIKLGALATTTKNGKTEARISPLGKTLSVFPLSPAYAKVIAMANQHGLMPYAIALIAALSVREPLISVSSLRGATDDETKAKMTEVLKLRRGWCGKGPARRLGDLMVLLRAVTASEKEKMSPSGCDALGLRYKAMTEIRRLRTQLTNIVNTSFKQSDDVTMDPKMPPPSDAQAQMLRQMMTAGLCERIAKRVDRSIGDEEVPKGAYQTMRLKEYVFIDPCSVVYTEEPDWLLYQDIVQLGDRKCMQTIMSVDHEWIPRLAESYCSYSAMDKEEEPRYNKEKDEIVKSVKVTFGPLEWNLDNVDRQIPNDIMLYRYFAQFLLAGEVMPLLAEYVPKMLAPPTTMVRSWAKLQQRTEALLNQLIDKNVHSRAALVEVWEKNEDYLLEAYLQWLPETLHPTVTLMWPPLEQKTTKMGRNKKYT